MVSLSTAFAALLNIAKKTQPNIDTTSLEGRSFCVAIDELPQDISIRITDGKVTALDEAEVADVMVSGSLKAIIQMINDESNGLESDELYIAGKISTARQFQQFLASFSLDWQAFFSQFMPEELANKTASAVEQGIHAAKGGVEQLGDNLKNYLLYDKKFVVTQPEFDIFTDKINGLNERLDSIFAKLDNVNIK